MNPFYFGTSANPLFGVHHPPTASDTGHAVLLCYPVGSEYLRAHRAFRQLTSLLVRAGAHVLRFDYRGTGDSWGDPADASVDRWLDDIDTAIQELKDSSGLDRVSLAGLRFGLRLSDLSPAPSVAVDVLTSTEELGVRTLVELWKGRRGPDAAPVGYRCIPSAGDWAVADRFGVATHVRARLPWKTPLEFLHYEARDHVRQIAQFAGNQVYDAVIWVSPLYADYIRYLRPAIRSKRWIIDFIDSPSLHKSRRLGALRLDLAQWQMLLWEARMIRSADMSVYVSPVDAGTVPRALSGGKVPYVIPNGTYIDDYIEGRTGSVSPFSIGFLGHMGYPPNIQAAMKLYEHIYRPLKKRLPELELYIIGRAPPEQVKALAKEESVCVTGSVESIWPFLNAVSVFVLPLDTGAGQQNKIIEIMHAGRPVIASRIANGGIGAVHGQHMVVCGKNLDGWVEAAYDLLTNREKAEELGRAGRQFAMERYTWSEICPQFESLIGDVSVDAGPTGNIQLIQDGVRLRPASQGK